MVPHKARGGGEGKWTLIYTHKRKGQRHQEERVWERRRRRRGDSTSQTCEEAIASRNVSLRNELGSYFSKTTHQLPYASQGRRCHSGEWKKPTLQTVNCGSLVFRLNLADRQRRGYTGPPSWVRLTRQRYLAPTSSLSAL